MPGAEALAADLADGPHPWGHLAAEKGWKPAPLREALAELAAENRVTSIPWRPGGMMRAFALWAADGETRTAVLYGVEATAAPDGSGGWRWTAGQSSGTAAERTAAQEAAGAAANWQALQRGQR